MTSPRAQKQFWNLASARDFTYRRIHPERPDVLELNSLLSAMVDHIIETEDMDALDDFLGDAKTAKDIHGFAPTGFVPPPEEQEVIDSLGYSAAKSRRSNWTYRCGSAALEAEKNGWYILFATLTFRDELDDEGVYKAWRRYYMRMRRLIADHCEEPATQCTKHFFYGEGDAITKRRHFHGIWYFKDVPDAWKRDPNMGWGPCNRECPWGVDALWHEGYAKHKAVRSTHDSWSALGWRWPVVKGQPLKCLPVQQGVTYVTKYLSKEIGENREWSHRVKVSKELGVEKLRAVLRQTPTPMLRPLARSGHLTPEAEIISRSCAVPKGLMRHEAQLERFKRCWKARPNLMMRHRASKSSIVILSMLSSFLQLRPNLSRDGPSSWLDCVEHFRVTPGRGSGKRMLDAWLHIATHFPRPLKTQVQHSGGI